MATIHPNVDVTPEQIAAFCEKWQIIQFELFGSVLRDDFRPDSDIDVLVTLAPDSHGTLFDLVHMEDELKALFERDVDLVERPVIEKSENYIRRRNILSSTRPVYGA
jgi:predicted nucleotidyltransferase